MGGGAFPSIMGFTYPPFWHYALEIRRVSLGSHSLFQPSFQALTQHDQTWQQVLLINQSWMVLSSAVLSPHRPPRDSILALSYLTRCRHAALRPQEFPSHSGPTEQRDTLLDGCPNRERRDAMALAPRGQGDVPRWPTAGDDGNRKIRLLLARDHYPPCMRLCPTLVSVQHPSPVPILGRPAPRSQRCIGRRVAHDALRSHSSHFNPTRLAREGGESCLGKACTTRPPSRSVSLDDRVSLLRLSVDLIGLDQPISGRHPSRPALEPDVIQRLRCCEPVTSATASTQSHCLCPARDHFSPVRPFEGHQV